MRGNGETRLPTGGFIYARIKKNQLVPPGAVVISIVSAASGPVAILGRYGRGPGGAGWLESGPMPVVDALNEARNEQAADPGAVGSSNAQHPRRGKPVIFVHFGREDQWDPSWGEWSWVRPSGAPMAKRAKRDL